MRLSYHLIARTLLLAIVPLAGLSGCGNEPKGTRSDGATDRYARSFLPFQAEWIRESEIPTVSQESRWMVIWEVSELDPNVAPTPEQTQAANDLAERCFQAALDKGWFDRANGLRDDFYVPGGDPKHYRNDEYVLDGITLDPERPEYLMYSELADGSYALTGFMFLADAPQSRGPQIAGALSNWHYHVWKKPRCWAQELLSAGVVDENGKCEKGVRRHRSPEMLHIWLIDHPRGMFSSGMALPKRILLPGLKKRLRERGV